MRRRRLRYRAWHRGTRELDFMLGPFADAHLGSMEAPELESFEALFAEEDTDLQKWLLGQEPAPSDAARKMLDRMIAFRHASTRP